LLAGRQPGEIVEQVLGTDRVPDEPLDWKAAIQVFVNLARSPVHTYTRPNRRFPDRVGQVPGRAFHPHQIQRPRILVAIDTSGSMNSDDLAETARQLIPLADLADITIVECDAQIQRVYAFTGSITSFAGRGGTDLRPVFAPEFLRRHHPDGIVYFTDGYGPFPLQEPSVRTLWVLTSDSRFPCPWGRKSLLRRCNEAHKASSSDPQSVL
jgi:predicted metal-dependent peptidase